MLAPSETLSVMRNLEAKKTLQMEGVFIYTFLYMTLFTASITSCALGNHSSRSTGE